jgi:hypothetical protein
MGIMQSPSKAGGVEHALTRDGIELPVLDVTNPRFAVKEDPASLQALHEAFKQNERQRRFIPDFLMRLMIRSAARKSLLMHALFGSDAEYLDGISTYVMKLGPENLVPPYASPMDKKFAASPHVTFLRLRTQQVASLLAEGLATEIMADGQAPLHLINIGGGPAIDSLNALLLLARLKDTLAGRKVVIDVLDLDEKGVWFGRNALAVMMQDGNRLAGLDIAFSHHSYDWNDPAPLRDLVERAVSQGAIVAASSEGALFEYGSDEAIVANLKALRAARFVVGSVTRADEARRRLMSGSRLKLIMRGLEIFEPLAAAAGFAIAQTRPSVWSDQILLRPKREDR